MTDDRQFEVSRLVAAPPERVFALLSDPEQHHAVEGSGPLQVTTGAVVTRVGQVFEREILRRRPIGCGPDVRRVRHGG